MLAHTVPALLRKDAICHIFETFKQLNPHPTTELVYHNPFQLLIAVILSAQSTDKMVNKVTVQLFKHAPNAKKMAELPVREIEKLIGRLGLYRNKAIFVHTCSTQLLQHHNGKVPQTREELMALAGVGRKTANVILNTLYDQNEIAVDTHIFRVANRLGLARASTPLGVEKKLLTSIPKSYQRHAHHWLILHGRYICKARQPQCQGCPVETWCQKIKLNE